MDSIPTKRHKSLPINSSSETLVPPDITQEEEDRISNLPDSILCHILSKLPTKYAVNTPLLSSRWRQLFSQIPNHHHVVITDKHPHSHCTNFDPVTHNTRFINFMTNLLLNNSSTLRNVPRIPTFKLKIYENDYHDSLVESWISAIFRLNNIESLYLSFFASNIALSPHTDFTSTTLVELQLGGYYFLIVPTRVNFPSLKILTLDKLELMIDDSLERLLLGCPVLETLVFQACVFIGTEVLRISLPLLKSLTINCRTQQKNFKLELYTPILKALRLTCVGFSIEDSLDRALTSCPVLERLFLQCCQFEIIRISSAPLLKFLIITRCHIRGNELVIDAPSLEKLLFLDVLCGGNGLMKNVNNSLRTAYIETSKFKQLDGQGPPVNYGFVADFVASCSSVEKLYLSKSTLVAIQKSYRAMPTFHNLTKLKLGVMKRSGYYMLPHLLQRSPNLQVLVFTEGFKNHKGCYTIFEGCLPKSVPICLSLHLQKIKIVRFNGKKDELKLIAYFLKNAPGLRKVKIRWAEFCSNKKRIRKKLLMLPKCSNNCQFEFITDDSFFEVYNFSSEVVLKTLMAFYEE